MSVFFQGGFGTGRSEREAYASRTRGALHTWTLKVVLQPLLKFLKVRIRRSIVELTRVTAVENNQNAACFFVLKKYFTEPAERKVCIVIVLDSCRIEVICNKEDIIHACFDRQSFCMSAKEKKHEIAILDLLCQIYHSTSHLFCRCLFAEQRRAKKFKSTGICLQDLGHISCIIDRILEGITVKRSLSIHSKNKSKTPGCCSHITNSCRN